MTKCTACAGAARAIKNPHRTYTCRRWRSYDRAALTTEALSQKVQNGFGNDQYAQVLKLNANKTISTAAGDLPISPVFDASWIKARRRQTKSAPTAPSGRFRKKLANNPFARALATPIRKCPVTQTYLPRYFLQDWELVKHPETGEPWWAPGPSTFEHVEPSKRPRVVEDSNPTAETEVVSAAETKAPRRSPITTYSLCRKDLISAVGGPNRKNATMLLAQRSGMAITPDTKNAVFRHDMADVLLGMMRRKAVDALLARSTSNTKQKFLEPCESWNAIKDIEDRVGCILWLPAAATADAPGGTEDNEAEYATLDIEEAKYGRKMVVHNLRWLLGQEQLTRLMGGAPMFRDESIILLKQWRSESMMRLHMLLWRLQGYLAQAKP